MHCFIHSLFWTILLWGIFYHQTKVCVKCCISQRYNYLLYEYKGIISRPVISEYNWIVEKEMWKYFHFGVLFRKQWIGDENVRLFFWNWYNCFYVLICVFWKFYSTVLYINYISFNLCIEVSRLTAKKKVREIG